METYLSLTLEKLRSNRYGEITIVIGNESCDLDSAVSALVYAAFLNWQYSQIKCKVCTRASRDESEYKDDIFIPILNINREDYELKTEVSYCMREHGIDAGQLIFRDDFNLEELVAKTKSSVVLVDHHVLAQRDLFLTPHVTEIIDHRPVDKRGWKYKEDTRTNIELVGSCCSLVAHRVRALGNLLSKEADFFNALPNATDLLYCGIILDTVNFSKEVNKATPVDEDAVVFLEGVLRLENNLQARKTKLDALVAARSDVSRLSAAQLLRKDVKLARDILVPSFPILVEEYLKKPLSLRSVTEALQQRSCNVAVLLGMSLDNGLHRDVAVLGLDSERAAKLAKHLQDWKAPPLQLVPEHLETANNCFYFKQNNLSASRKQYMPAVSSFLDEKNLDG